MSTPDMMAAEHLRYFVNHGLSPWILSFNPQGTALPFPHYQSGDLIKDRYSSEAGGR
jgi:hypothetical protein